MIPDMIGRIQEKHRYSLQQNLTNVISAYSSVKKRPFFFIISSQEVFGRSYIEDIKDFPEEGIIFRDVTPLLKDKEAYKESIDTFAKWIDGLGVQVDVVAGPEARGFYLDVLLLTK